MPLATRPHCLELAEAISSPFLVPGDCDLGQINSLLSVTRRETNFSSKLEHLRVKGYYNTYSGTTSGNQDISGHIRHSDPRTRQMEGSDGGAVGAGAANTAANTAGAAW